MEVEARIVRLQLAETFVIAREQTDYADVVHVAVTHEGTTGYGEAAPVDRYDESTQSAMAFIDEHGALVGDDPFALEDVGERLGSIAGEQAAKSALDAALHDLQGKLLGVPAFRLLGAAANRAADLMDDLARRPGRHGTARRAGRGDVPPAQAQARRWRRPRRRACSRRPRRDRPAAHGRRQRVVVPRRGARRAPAARGDRRRVLRAAAPRRRRGRHDA